MNANSNHARTSKLSMTKKEIKRASIVCGIMSLAAFLSLSIVVTSCIVPAVATVPAPIIPLTNEAAKTSFTVQMNEAVETTGEYEPISLDSVTQQAFTSMVNTMSVASKRQRIAEGLDPEPIYVTRFGIYVSDYDPTVDYTTKMRDMVTQAIADPEHEAEWLAMAELYECQRNYKIQAMHLDDASESHIFNIYNENSVEEMRRLAFDEPWYPYTEYDVVRLASVIYREAGSDWISDKHQRDCGSVVLNRTRSWRYPGTTIAEIIDQPGQYPHTKDSRYYTQREWDNAIYILENGPTCDAIFQANFTQGDEIVAIYEYPESSRVTYMCKWSAD